MNKIKELMENTQFDENEIDELIKLLKKQKQEKQKNNIIKYIGIKYNEFCNYLKTIIDIEIKNNIASYNQELYINIYCDNLIISKSYIGTIDGEEQNNIYTISTDSDIIYKFVSHYNFFHDINPDDIDNDVLINSIVNVEKMTKLAKLYKKKIIDFVKDIICLLDILNWDKIIHKFYNDKNNLLKYYLL